MGLLTFTSLNRMSIQITGDCPEQRLGRFLLSGVSEHSPFFSILQPDFLDFATMPL
jgi:hypothetical protein